MSSFSSETLHPRARPAPLPSLCMSPSTQVAADQRAVGNRHHLFNRTVAPAWCGLVRSVGFTAQSVACGRLCGSGVPLPPLRPQSPPEYPDCTAITCATPWSHLRLARKPDNLRVNRFIRTQTRSLARGQRRPRAHLAVNVRIKGPTRTSKGLLALHMVRARMTG